MPPRFVEKDISEAKRTEATGGLRFQDSTQWLVAPERHVDLASSQGKTTSEVSTEMEGQKRKDEQSKYVVQRPEQAMAAPSPCMP